MMKNSGALVEDTIEAEASGKAAAEAIEEEVSIVEVEVPGEPIEEEERALRKKILIDHKVDFIEEEAR